VGWLDRRLRTFSPCRGGYPEAWRLKAFGELALVVTYLQQWGHLRGHRSLRRWRAFIADHLDDRVYGELARKQPAVAFAYLAPYLMFRSTGYRSPYLEDTLRLFVRRGFLAAQESVPYRVMERAHALWKSGYLPAEPKWRRLARPTALLKRGNPLAWDDDAAYSVTHTLFYLTDFGNRPGPLTKVEADHAVRIVECLLVHYCRIRHWDLVGELLINLNCLPSARSLIGEAAVRRYRSAWRKDGAVPPLGPRPPGLRDGEGPRDPFRRYYHSTLVAVLFCATEANRRAAARPLGPWPN
jgi:hypothetical protein